MYRFQSLLQVTCKLTIYLLLILVLVGCGGGGGNDGDPPPVPDPTPSENDTPQPEIPDDGDPTNPSPDDPVPSDDDTPPPQVVIPELIIPPLVNYSLGENITFILKSNIEDKNPVFGAKNLPENSKLDAITGEFAFKPSAAQTGTHEIFFTMTADDIPSVENSVIITIEEPDSNAPTLLSGRILDTNEFVSKGAEVPVAGATISIIGLDVTTTSDLDGNFTLGDIPLASAEEGVVLDIDPGTADPGPGGAIYAGFREKITLIAHVNHAEKRPFYLPQLESDSLTQVNPNEETVVKNERLGISFVVPAGTARNPDGSNYEGVLSIAEVPDGLAPAAMPPQFNPDLLVTIQPVGISFETPVPITFPNSDNLAPGSEVDIWSLDPEVGVFVVVGTGIVSDDGAVVETVKGGIRATDWHFIAAALANLIPDPMENIGSLECQVKTGSSTKLCTGALVANHALVPYRSLNQYRGLNLVYDSLRANPQPIFNIDATIPVRMAIPELISTSLEVGGVSLSGDIYTSTDSLNENIDETIRTEMHFDASALPTGLYPYRAEFTSYFGASSFANVGLGDLVVGSRRNSNIGAGWGIDSVSRIYPQPNGKILLMEGDGSTLIFKEETLTLFSDNFDSENGGIGQGNYDSLNFWDITDGAVDLIGNGLHDFYPGNGLFLDLDGSTFNAATLKTKEVFDLSPGTYTLEFMLGGNARGGEDNVTISLGEIWEESFTLSSLDPLELITRTVEVDKQTSAGLEIEHEGGDNVGIIFDDVRLFTSADTGIYKSPAGDFSRLRKQADGTYIRSFNNGTSILYNSDGFQEKIVDRNGNNTEFAYDENHFLIKITDSVGLTTDLFYENGYLSTITDPAGRVTRFKHDNEGNLIRITDPDGSERSFNYNFRHQLISQESKNGHETIYEYDNAGRNILVKKPDGSTVSVIPSQNFSRSLWDTANGSKENPLPSFKPEENIARHKDGAGNETRIVVNKFGSINSTEDSLERKRIIERDDNSNPVRIVRANGSSVKYQYNNKGKLVSILDEEINAATSFTYEPLFNQLSSITDPAENTTSIAYDSNGNPILITDAKENKQEFTYNGRGQVETFTDERGFTATYTYNAKGNLETVTDHLLGTVTLAYDLAGNISEIEDANGNITSYIYDELNRIKTITDALTNKTEFTYDNGGNIKTAKNPDEQVTEYFYDELGRIIKIDNPVSGATTYDYDLAGNLKKVTNSLEDATEHFYDSANQLIKTVDARGGEIEYGYDIEGNIESVTDQNDNVTRFVYDRLSRLRERIAPDGLKEIFTYDIRSNLQTATNRRNQTTTNIYDELSRITNINSPDNNIALTYDKAGNIVNIKDNDSDLDFTFDALGRLETAVTKSGGVQPEVTLTYSYDNSGRRISLEDSAGGKTEYDYFADDSLKTLTTAANNIITFDYDATGRLSEIDFPGGISGSYSYDAQGLLETISHGGDITDFVDITYGYNEVGNIISAAEATQTRSYTYDELQQIVAGGTVLEPENYSYDSAGNRIDSHLSAQHSHSNNNSLDQDDRFKYIYDNDGNLLQKTNLINNEVTAYIWDSQNQLIGITHPDSTSTSYKYDGLGRRIEKNVNGLITRYIYDGEDIVLEYNGSNILQARYTHGALTDQPLALETAGQEYYYHTDHLGSIRAITDGAGNIVNSYEYDTYGNTISVTETITNPYRYTAREYDSETGLLYYRARYYDSNAGRFISEDPIGFTAGDTNLYRYVFNNPQNSTDPSGLSAGLINKANKHLNIPMLTSSFKVVSIGYKELFGDTLGGGFSCLFLQDCSFSDSNNDINDVITDFGLSNGLTNSTPNDYCANNPDDPICDFFEEPKTCIFGKNTEKKIRKHIDQVRNRHGIKQDIPRPRDGGNEIVKEIIRKRVEQGGGVYKPYAGQPAFRYFDGNVEYIIRPNGQFWTILSR